MHTLQSLSRWTLSLLFMSSALSSGAPVAAFQAPTTAAVAPVRAPRLLATSQAREVTTTVLEVPAAADTYIASGRPTQNFGTRGLFLGYSLADTFAAERMLLRFDLSNLPAEAVVQDARLRLYLIYGSPAGDPPMNTIIRRLASTWSEGAVTWNTEPTWASVRAESSVGLTPGWYEWNITDLASAWVQETLANQGMEVEGDENVQQRERAFYSRETTTAFYPRLIVTYNVVSDTLPPQVTVTALPPYNDRVFTVAWSGSDPGASGIHHFDVQYQVDGGPWLDWQMGVTGTSAEFIGLNDHLYAFRARGVDNTGNIEAFGGAEAQTLVDILAPAAWVNPLPAQVTAAPFLVTWGGDDHGGSGLQNYDVRYRFNEGAWTNWQTTTPATSAEFTAIADGFYEFEARGTDHAQLTELFTGQPEASTGRDVEAPFVLPMLWLPFMVR